MEAPKPIKRNKAFVEFSKDHHFALLLVWKIRRDFSQQVAPEIIAQQALEFYDRELKYHFKQEEEYIFTLVTPVDPLRIQAENDHKKIYSLVESIKQNGCDIQDLKEFADLLEAHIRFEERILFNHLQEKMKPQELEELFLKINEVRSKLDP